MLPGQSDSFIAEVATVNEDFQVVLELQLAFMEVLMPQEVRLEPQQRSRCPRLCLLRQVTILPVDHRGT